MPARPIGDDRFRTQQDALRALLGDGAVDVWFDDVGAPVAVYDPTSLLARTEEDRDAILEAVPGNDGAEAGRAGVHRVRLGRRVADPGLPGLDHLLNRDGVSLNHLVTITPIGSCPADEPVAVDLPFNPALDPVEALGGGTTVLIVDTGLFPGFTKVHPWLEHDTVPVGLRDVADPGDPGLIKEYAGHGTFIAGLVRAVAPGAALVVSNHLQNAGQLDEWTLGNLLLEVLDGFAAEHDGRWPEVISLSAGTSTADGRALAGLERFRAELRDHGETVLIAAAGNNGDDRPFLPAAWAGPFPEPEPGVVAVGAIRQDGRGPACFTDFGPWVSVYAPGERLVGAFLGDDRPYEYRDNRLAHCRYHPDPVPEPDCTCLTHPEKGARAVFSGRAEWSGTSFSTPIVAGLVAARRSHVPGLTSRQAAAAILAEARVLPGLGPVVTPPTWTAKPLP